MIRIISWNIQRFTAGKYATHANTILDVIHPVGGLAATADVFILIEVFGSPRPWGEVCFGSGANGTQALRDGLIAREPSWKLIPPLSLHQGSREGIAIFYRSDRLRMVGPQVYGDEVGTPPHPRVPLPVEWRDQADPNNLANLNNHRVGKVRFADLLGRQINFPEAGERRPYYAEFAEVVTHGVARGLRVLGFHAPEPGQSQGQDAIAGTGALAEIPQIDPAHASHNHIFIAGDFNCDTADADADRRADRIGAFAPLTNGAMDNPAGLQFDMDIPANAKTSLKVVNNTTANDYYSCAYDKILTPQASDARDAAVIDLVTGTPAGYPGIASYAANMHTGSFRSGVNFGRVRGLSDHFPIKIDMW